MKTRAVLLASLGLAALAATTASAATFEGTCSYGGTLSSSPGLTFAGGFPMNYKIAATRMTCAGTLDGAALPAGQRVDLEIVDGAPGACETINSLQAQGKLRFVRGVPDSERPGGNAVTDPSGDDRLVDPSGDNETGPEGETTDPSGDDYLEDPSGDNIVDPDDALQTFGVALQSAATEIVTVFYSGTSVVATGSATFRDSAQAAVTACAGAGLKQIALTGDFTTTA